MNLSDFRLKDFYDLREVKIPTDRSTEDIRRVIKGVITPAVADLESQDLIGGFYFIVHADIDLRMSCDDWDGKEGGIKSVLEKHGIPTRMQPLDPAGDVYGGSIMNQLNNNCLEFHSRLVMAYLQALEDPTSNPETMEKMYPERWMHYLYNQFGLMNFTEGVREIEYGFEWFARLLIENPTDPELKSLVHNALSVYVDKFKRLKERTQ